MEHTRAFLAYDTLCRIAAEIPEDGEQLLEQCEEEAHGLERTLSMFDPDSELSRLCRDIRPGEAVPVSETLYTFLEQNLEICRLSGGAFDPTVGPVVKLWDFLSQTPRIPSAERIRAVLDRVGYQHVRLDRNTRTVTFDLSGIGLDPGAAGKGFALGLTVDRLRQGGTRPWKVAIRDPDNTGSVFGTVQLQDAGIATSSWYEHSFQKNGTVYHHLLDPRTGYPMPLTLKSVSILSSRPVYTDLLSTAFFILGEEEGGVLVDRLRRDSGEMIEYVAVREDGTVAASPGAAFAPA